MSHWGSSIATFDGANTSIGSSMPSSLKKPAAEIAACTDRHSSSLSTRRAEPGDKLEVAVVVVVAAMFGAERTEPRRGEGRGEGEEAV